MIVPKYIKSSYRSILMISQSGELKLSKAERKLAIYDKRRVCERGFLSEVDTIYSHATVNEQLCPNGSSFGKA
jgi:hypothetical protein